MTKEQRTIEALDAEVERLSELAKQMPSDDAKYNVLKAQAYVAQAMHSLIRSMKKESDL